VDTGSEYTWLPCRTLESIGIQREKKDVTFVMANGQQVTRNIGFAIVRSGSFFTVDEVVFAETGDLSLLGARTLEGFNARVDAHRKQLVAAGPLPAASAGRNEAGRERRHCLGSDRLEVGMPTVLRIGPYRFFFFSADCDEPSHVHVERDDAEAKFWLDPVGEAYNHGFRAAELRTVRELVEANRDFLQEA